jgi:hypothetical protein
MARKYLTPAFFLLCALEGCMVLVRIWPPGGLQQGVFSARMALAALVALLALVLAALGVRQWLVDRDSTRLSEWILVRRSLVALLFLCFASALLVGWVLVFSPLRAVRLAGYFLRWQPFFIWLLLIPAQSFLLALALHPIKLWLQTFRDLRIHPGLAQARRILLSPQFGLALLAISFLLGMTKLVFGQFVDEAENLQNGWLITRDLWPYRDVFTQHFPLAYYWMGIVTALSGNSQAAGRMSLLVLQLVLLALSMRLSRLHLPLGIATLAWGLTSHFHRGNLVLYDTFDGIFIVSSIAVVFSLLLEPASARRSGLVFTGILLACAMISNPLMLYPAALALGAVWLAGFRLRKEAGWGKAWQYSLWAGGSAAVVLGAFFLFLALNGSLYGFYRQTIWFNANIYNQYTDGSPLRLGRIVYQLVSGLDVLNPQWRQHIFPVIDPGVVRFRIADEALYYSWIFSSLLFRISILLCVLGLFLRRKFLAGFFLYVFAASLLVRADTSWHAIPFIWLSLFAGGYLLTNLAAPPDGRRASAFSRLGRPAWRLVYLGFLVMYAWSALFGAYFLLDHRQALSDRRYLNRIERFGDEIRRITCQQEDVELLIYPFNPLVYYLSEIEPASLYTFMHPWVAEVGQQAVIETLKEHPSAVVEIRRQKRVWQDYVVEDYLSDLITFLDDNYWPVSDTLWVSPELGRDCTANLSVPFSGESSDEE